LKPIHVNLASRPFRDYRPVYAVVVVTSLLVAFLMLNNFDTWYRYQRDTKSTRTDIDRYEAQIEQERRRGDVASQQIKGLDLTSLGKQAKFVNAQLAERAFSWSELLDRLEAVMPNDVRIISVAPSFGADGQVHLNLACEAKSSDGMVATITRFQNNQHFANPFPSNEENTGTSFRFGLGVDYKPSIPRVVAQ
jgi:DNA-binding helix-hairpin-helix protein with protein kinase domain